MKFLALLIGGAVLPYLFDTALQPAFALLLLLSSLILVLVPRTRHSGSLLLLFVSMFVFTSLSIHQRLGQRIDVSMDKAVLVVSGRVVGLPETRSDHIRFFLHTDYKHKLLADRLISVSWHIRNAQGGVLPEVRAGQVWQFPVRLRTTRGQVNFVGADPERWSFIQGIAARAYVDSDGGELLQPPSVFDLGHWRETVLEKILATAGDAPAVRMLVALAVADRRGLSGHDRDVLADTGTGHLLAISGLHIGLAAVMGFYIGRLVLLFFYAGASLKLAVAMPWLFAWLSSLGYAGLAGFGVSTQRALIMLTVATLLVLCRRKVHPSMAWMMAMCLVLLMDPFAPLRAGFWFSFIAVGILLMQFSPRFGAMPWWRKALQAQLAISLIMAPLGMYWFQQASLPGLLANLVAIPMVSFITVPLILLGLVTMWVSGWLGAYLFYAAGYSVQALLQLLEVLAAWQPDFMISAHAPGLPLVLFAMLGAVILVMPRGLPGRAIGVLLMLPVLLPPANPLTDDQVQVDMLDVGQGLAVLAGSQNYLMLYDTGPGNGLEGIEGWDTVKGTILPAIAQRAISPDLVVVSHADLDHAGGLSGLQSFWPKAEFLGSLPQARVGVSDCRARGKALVGSRPAHRELIAIDSIRLQVLHPADGLPYLGNDSSCVVSLKSLQLSVLFTGDISKSVEHRLLMQGVEPHDVMTVAHHGSASSSSAGFVRAVQPEWALVSAESNNRFDFPRTEVLDRFSSAGIGVLNTADCGGIRLSSERSGIITVQSARKQRDAIWRFKADEFCP